jgi:hypothetical protein
VLDSTLPDGHCDLVPLTPSNLDKVMSELVAVSRSAMSKREEAANLARIWGQGKDSSEFRPPVTVAPVLSPPDDLSVVAPTADRVRRRARWRRVA